jgi:hypothetical protein
VAIDDDKDDEDDEEEDDDEEDEDEDEVEDDEGTKTEEDDGAEVEKAIPPLGLAVPAPRPRPTLLCGTDGCDEQAIRCVNLTALTGPKTVEPRATYLRRGQPVLSQWWRNRERSAHAAAGGRRGRRAQRGRRGRL